MNVYGISINYKQPKRTKTETDTTNLTVMRKTYTSAAWR